ncbi:GreA/GreB family elongation factor, partial [Marinospirillum sp.]|uniref:GreA/GreB family elongation factor n=1 Tax=Marinospirillum sp. TaxID=2183934 RepID=UPI0028705C30
YTYNKRELNRTLSRIGYLDKRLDELRVVDRQPADLDRVYFGAWITLENEEGEEQTWRIVGPDEADASKGMMSIDAPRSRLLLGKQLDEEVQLPTPEGQACYIITTIRYC